MLKIVRSPARVCWHIVCNGQVIDTANTRYEAEAVKLRLERKYGV